MLVRVSLRQITVATNIFCLKFKKNRKEDEEVGDSPNLEGKSPDLISFKNQLISVERI